MDTDPFDRLMAVAFFSEVILFIVFLTLKLTHVIDGDWWLIPAVVPFICLYILGGIGWILMIIDIIKRR